MIQPPATDSLSFLPPSKLGELIRHHDWSSSGLGAPALWPQSLKSVTSMLLASPVPIVLLWGVKGIMIYNDAYSIFAGERHPRLLGSEVRKGWAEVAEFNDQVMRVGLAGQTLAYKDQELTLYRHGHAEQVWMDLDYSPVYDESGTPGGVIAIVVETTSRVLVRRNLQQSEQRLRALVNATADVVYRVSPDWRTLRQLEGKGFLKDAMPSNLSWLDTYVPPQHQPEVNRAIAEAIRHKTTFTLEHPVIRADETLGWVLSRAVPLFDEHGEIIEWFGTATDVTSRREAEEALRANERRLHFLDALGKETARSNDADVIMATTTRMLGEHLEIAVCAYADMESDQDSFTIRGDWHAPGSASIVGHYRLADFGKLAMHNLHSGMPLILNDNANELEPAEAQAFLSIGLAATICMPLVKDGRLTALMAIHDRVPRCWTPRELSLLTEVAERSWAHIERVRAESRRRDSEERFRLDLEARVLERTEALRQSEAAIRRTEQALHQSQKMEALGNLTGGIAHDFNNLLMAVIGSLELLRRRMPPTPQLLQLVDNARTGAERGATLIARMLAFARRQELRAEAVELGELITGMSELLQRSLGPTIELQITPAPALVWVLTDPNQLEAALLNLAVNARDAMDGQGHIRIEASLRTVQVADAQLRPGEYGCLCVIDDGRGMDEETLKRATEPFFTTKGIGEGTGLGLSMVHGLVQQSGGALRLSSNPGIGTTAELWLPATTAPEQLLDSSVQHPVRDLAHSAVWDILAVDDDELVRLSTVEMLKDMGHRVQAASSAREALIWLDRQRFDMMISDHAMPHMTGTQLATLVRERWPQMPLILVSGYADTVTGLPSEIPCLAKPFSQAQLMEVMSAVGAKPAPHSDTSKPSH
ncbi:GAF domain-containing protein [Pseudomonas sp. NFACC02]|uniref:ATP-binding protein n=1 Tax=Pseudomonas sp. NFACC02 TaxID=1566250 RepID=UPI0008C4C232|nr:ATP-binding protein [Pseudomonas sp. NFACC02]SEP97906.1 GAF domain-containing protein [Pseudomonas sp. NFACC02]